MAEVLETAKTSDEKRFAAWKALYVDDKSGVTASKELGAPEPTIRTRAKHFDAVLKTLAEERGINVPSGNREVRKRNLMDAVKESDSAKEYSRG